MKIKMSELRKLIKEELTRARGLQESGYYDLDDEADDEAPKAKAAAPVAASKAKSDVAAAEPKSDEYAWATPAGHKSKRSGQALLTRDFPGGSIFINYKGHFKGKLIKGGLAIPLNKLHLVGGKIYDRVKIRDDNMIVDIDDSDEFLEGFQKRVEAQLISEGKLPPGATFDDFTVFNMHWNDPWVDADWYEIRGVDGIGSAVFDYAGDWD